MPSSAIVSAPPQINDVVVFDRVLHRSGPKRLRLQGQRHKYLLTDPFAPFLYVPAPRNGGTAAEAKQRRWPRPAVCTYAGHRGQNVTYSLHCNIIPYAGALQQSRWGGNTVKVAL